MGQGGTTARTPSVAVKEGGELARFTVLRLLEAFYPPEIE
jgi:hypothetical protein